MDETQKPRLRLSRRRPPPERGCPDGRPWFLLQGVRECEQPWAALVRVASAELGADRELPPLPARPGQEPTRTPERATTPEVFTVGCETFTWPPFPPTPRQDPACPLPAPPAQVLPDPRQSTPTKDPPLEDGAPTLRSCPLCQADFAPTLTQLDIDGHLAQCLAGSTEAEMW